MKRSCCRCILSQRVKRQVSVPSWLVERKNPHMLHSTMPPCCTVIFTRSVLLIRCSRILLTSAQISSWLSTFDSFVAFDRFFGYTTGSNGTGAIDFVTATASAGSCNHSNASLGNRNQRMRSVESSKMVVCSPIWTRVLTKGNNKK